MTACSFVSHREGSWSHPSGQWAFTGLPSASSAWGFIPLWNFVPEDFTWVFFGQYSGLQTPSTLTRQAVLQSKPLLSHCSCEADISPSPNTTDWAKEVSGCQYLGKVCRCLAGFQVHHATMGENYIFPKCSERMGRCWSAGAAAWMGPFLLNSGSWWRGECCLSVPASASVLVSNGVWCYGALNVFYSSLKSIF